MHLVGERGEAGHEAGGGAEEGHAEALQEAGLPPPPRPVRGRHPREPAEEVGQAGEGAG